MYRSRMEFGGYLVLIDTWWNVNTFKIYNSSVVVSVLIDTWWNVNMISAGKIANMYGF